MISIVELLYQKLILILDFICFIKMAANGIDIKKVVIPGDNTSDIVSSSTTTISHEDATVVTKIITTKVITTEMVSIFFFFLLEVTE